MLYSFFRLNPQQLSFSKGIHFERLSFTVINLKTSLQKQILTWTYTVIKSDFFKVYVLLGSVIYIAWHKPVTQELLWYFGSSLISVVKLQICKSRMAAVDITMLTPSLVLRKLLFLGYVSGTLIFIFPGFSASIWHELSNQPGQIMTTT